MVICERIFGPIKDWDCGCGKYKNIRYKGVICDRCGVEVTGLKLEGKNGSYFTCSTSGSHMVFKRNPIKTWSSSRYILEI